jgi:bifunctional UDP-N-acetylglucosamine pyrophosphorylase / glucosamine-1-phosphate N-acetyltransferase
MPSLSSCYVIRVVTLCQCAHNILDTSDPKRISWQRPTLRIEIVLNMTEYAALILAAGKGTRMKSHLCKVLHPIAGRPMILYVTDSVREAGFNVVVTVVGHQAEEVKKTLAAEGTAFAFQEPQLGTGHAVASARNLLEDFQGDIFVLCGDIPLLRPDTIRKFLHFHEEHRSKLTVMTTCLDNPKGYGRVIRNGAANVTRIVEDRDASEDEKKIREINTGVYLMKASFLYSLLGRITPDNAQAEYYLTDVVSEACKDSVPVYGYVLENSEEAAGINSRSELARASAVVWNRVRESLMDAGVTLLDPGTVYVDAAVQIGPDTVIHPGVTISGESEIGTGCVIESGVYIIDSKVGDRVHILQGSRLNNAVVLEDSSIGPMAHLRPETHIGREARVGNFVELKKTIFGDGSKASHLTYLGDSFVGEKVNIGCGTITCNYDGKRKHPTVIGDRCFVGSDVQFVAPVKIGEGSLIGAGSTITRDVPPENLAVTRPKQRNYPLRKGQGPAKSDKESLENS